MKSLRPVILISSLISLIGFGVAAYFLFSNKARFEGQTFSEALESGDLLGFIAIPIVLVITALVMWSVFRTISPPKIKNGVAAPARVLEVRDTGVSVNDNPQVALLVEVIPPTGTPFKTEVKTLVSRLDTALVQPGIEIEVIYDPAKPSRIQVVNMDLKPIELNSAESRLKELNRLYDQGLITGEEFRAKREEILKEL